MNFACYVQRHSPSKSSFPSDTAGILEVSLPSVSHTCCNLQAVSLHGSQMFRDTYISWVPAVPHFFHVVSPWRRREGWNAGIHLRGFWSLHYRIFSLLSHPLCSSAQRSSWIQRKLKSIRVCSDKNFKKKKTSGNYFFLFYCLIMPFLHICLSWTLPWLQVPTVVRGHCCLSSKSQMLQHQLFLLFYFLWHSISDKTCDFLEKFNHFGLFFEWMRKYQL